MEMPHLVLSVPSLFRILRSGGKHLKSLSIYKSCFLDVLLVLLLVILITSMFYLYPEAVQAKNIIQINKIISDVLERPHLPSGPFLLSTYSGWQGSWGEKKKMIMWSYEMF